MSIIFHFIFSDKVANRTWSALIQLDWLSSGPVDLPVFISQNWGHRRSLQRLVFMWVMKIQIQALVLMRHVRYQLPSSQPKTTIFKIKKECLFCFHSDMDIKGAKMERWKLQSSSLCTFMYVNVGVHIHGVYVVRGQPPVLSLPYTSFETGYLCVRCCIY